MGLILRKPGILTTVQDLGRVGYRCFGVNPNGVMDRAAARVANALLGNADGASCLEIHFPAPQIEFDADTVFAIGGADFGAELDGVGIRNWSRNAAEAGSVLRFAEKRFGTRAYISVPGGFQVEQWLGSASTNIAAAVGGISGRRLSKDERIEVASGSKGFSPLTAGWSLLPHYSRFPTVRVVAGAEFESLSPDSERSFLSEGFTLTNQCNRMGYRLEGKPLARVDDRPMVSAPVSFGTIQLLPDGQLIVLMADHQTSGGYPRIANVISTDLPLLAQCGPGDGVSFELVSIDDAEQLAMHFENELNILRVGCRLQSNAYG